MQQVWGTSTSQGRCHHQEPPDGPQGPGSCVEKGWDNHRYKCHRMDCDEEYTGESSRTLGERLKEHQNI